MGPILEAAKAALARYAELDPARVAQRLLDHYGYLVIGANGPRPIGTVLDGTWFLDQFCEAPLVIVAESTFEEWIEQLEFNGFNDEDRSHLAGEWYYRVAARVTPSPCPAKAQRPGRKFPLFRRAAGRNPGRRRQAEYSQLYSRNCQRFQ